MKRRSSFVPPTAMTYNTIVQRKSNLELVGKYYAKRIEELVEEKTNKRYAQIILPDNETTATYNLEEFEIRALIFAWVM